MVTSGAFGVMPDHLPLATVPPYVEVSSPDGKVWRFAAGTKAGFAVSRIKRKLPELSRDILCIEAVKEGEEPVEFGPDAELVHYGENWKLQILQEQDYLSGKVVHQEKLGAGFNREKVGAGLHLVKVGTGPNQERVGADYKAGADLQGQLCEIKDVVAEFYPGGKLPKGSKQEFSCEYIGRVVLSLGLMVLFAATLQYVLKSLPSF
ncbi:hypothetical protein O6H91_01G118200 [Diphasiastrum complanatum]|uniref:Uncharacterized protein n=2 Tax=Diphasiastrum complanatum TaxID=34168 RepID=A0ACC2EV67_DIPCM|nr:hypothetical protein O6H91_01G118100 [Diphasiastrum complanatum]KAJ7570399.1 hypothetical protein O6H91_01G118200 [Diphasiastrum complanatum]